VRGSRDLSAKSDQYSLGVVLYECVTGKAPFAGDSLLSILNSIAAGEFVKPSAVRFDVSEVMERTILRAMNPDPALRYDHVRDLGRELLEVAGIRSQMLWGRSFGRIDLSEPALDGPSGTAPLALRHPTTAPPRSARAGLGSRNAWLGLAALGAIVISNFWGMRAPDPAPDAASARVPQTGEASLRPAVDSLRAAVGPVHAVALGLDTPPAAAEPIATSAAPSVRRAAPANAAPVAEVRTNPALGAPSELATGGGERSRAPRRPRAFLVAEPRPQPRAALVPEIRSRLVPSNELAPEPYLDDVGRMFPPMEARQDGASKPALAPVPTGANESPILD
jgi:hypothetical protein